MAWLYRASGFDPAHPEAYHPPEKVDLAWAYDVVLTLDGRLIWFYTRTVLSRGGVRQYNVESGALTDMDRADEWRVWAAVHDGHAIRFGGGKWRPAGMGP
jgi:hypothetical protein